MAVLTFTLDGAVRDHALAAVTTIGRHPDCDLQLLDRAVAKQHATIVERRGVFLLAAHAPVSIDGRACDGVAPIALVHGDRVEVGGHVLTFRLPVVTPHGGVPRDLVGTPLGVAIAVVRVACAAAGDAAALPPVPGGFILARPPDGLTLGFAAAGPALTAALGIAGAARSRGALRLGADFAPLEAALIGAERAAAASGGELVATDSFAGRALLEAARPTAGLRARPAADDGPALFDIPRD